MNAHVRAALLLGGSIFACVALWAATQGQDGATSAHPPSVQPQVLPKPRNLRALPKEMSGEDVDRLMHQYQRYLGVPCGYCHEQDPETKTIDYASDQNPIKETARFMITMTSDINNKYLSRLGDRRYADPITCGNCHRGQVQPPNFELNTTP